MVAFEPMRETTVSGGRNEGLNFGNVVGESEGTGNGDPGGGGDKGKKLECWHCGGEHLKRNCLTRAEEEKKTKKDNGGKPREPTINALTVKQRQRVDRFTLCSRHWWTTYRGKTSVRWERSTNSPDTSSMSRAGEREILRDTHRGPCKTPLVV